MHIIITGDKNALYSTKKKKRKTNRRVVGRRSRVRFKSVLKTVNWHKGYTG
jgi:hypothetical protein